MNKICLYIILLLSSVTFAQDFTARVDSSKLAVGGQAKITLEYKGDKDFRWNYFNDNEEIIENLEVVTSSEFDTISISDQQIHLQQTLYITAWDSGYYAIPPFHVEINEEKIESNPLLIQFYLEEIEPDGEIKTIKSQADTPFTFDEIKVLVYSIIGIVLFVIGLILLLMYLRKRKLNQPQPEVIIPSRPKIEILWERFEIISANKSWQTGNEKDFQIEISLILREFLELKYKIKTVECTTGEITNQLSSIGIDQIELDKCKHVLNFSDMIKFAKHKGIESQHEQALLSLKSFLESYNNVEQK